MICFDLFFTLIDIKRAGLPTENEVLGLPYDEWRRYANHAETYRRRARGFVTEPAEIIREIAALTGREVTQAEQTEMLRRRVARYRASLTQVEPEILTTLRELRQRGHKLCLVSNADAIDTLHWDESPLALLFDHTVFSWQAGLMKPDPAIYLLSAQKLAAAPEECIFVGDGEFNELAGAKRVGMRTIQTRHFVQQKVDGADHIAERFAAILNII